MMKKWIIISTSALESFLLPLFLLGSLALTETWAGPHSLRYFDAVLSGPGLGEPRFLSVGYVDDQEFVRFDSGSANPRLEPRAPWMREMDPDYWERQTRLCEENARRYRASLENLRRYYNQSGAGVHTIQRRFGCEVSRDRSFMRGFEQYAYDGSDYLVLDTETLTWTAAVPEAGNTKLKVEANRSIAERHKSFLQEECVLWFNQYLQDGKEFLLRTDPPIVQVTHHTSPDGEVTLRCRTQGFYPKEISLTWLRDGQEQLEDVEFIETRPAGDGTFQKWAAVVMTSGNEGKYTCRVQHQGLPEPLTLKWDPKSSSFIRIIVKGIAVVVFLVVAGVVTWRLRMPTRYPLFITRGLHSN